MQRSLLFVSVLAVMLGAALPAMAQNYGFTQGDKEFTLSGAGSASNDFEHNTNAINTGIGWFIEDNLELAARLGTAWSTSPAESSSSFNAGVALDYHFDLDRFQPFIGANIGWIWGDDTEDTGIGGPEAGLKVFLNDTTFIVVNVTYQWLFANGDEDTQFEDGRFAYGLGLGLRF